MIEYRNLSISSNKQPKKYLSLATTQKEGEKKRLTRLLLGQPSQEGEIN